MKKRALSALLAFVLLLGLSGCAASAPRIYEVRFEMNGGTLVDGKLLQRVEEGSGAAAPEVERTGFTFDGWSESFDKVSENMVVVAEWVPVEPEPTPTPIYEVRFEMNGGTLVDGRLLQRVEEGSAAAAPEVEREGFAFDGWSESFDSVTENMVVVAQWSRRYQITFDAEGGRFLSGEAEQLVREGDLPEAPEVERDYSTFVGWSPAITAAEADVSYSALWAAQKLDSEAIYSKISPAVVEVSAYLPSGSQYSLGSGFFIDDSGRFVTNYHVIDGANAGEITLSDGSRCDILYVQDYDKALDLAIVQADVSGNEWLAISERPVTTGETIYALGSSQGLTSTFSTGIVSTAARDMDGVRCIQITAPISQGNSGGPLVDPYGEVVGVNSMTLITGQNLNFAIDIHELEKLTENRELTLAQIYELEYPNGDAASEGKEGFYEEADLAEKEPNDQILLSDTLSNGAWIAGEVSNLDDTDWFYLELDHAADVSFEVVPYYSDDMDYLLCGVLRWTGDDIELVEALPPAAGNDYDAFTGTIHLDTGTYFLILGVSEDYPFDSPAYYAAQVNW